MFQAYFVGGPFDGGRKEFPTVDVVAPPSVVMETEYLHVPGCPLEGQLPDRAVYHRESVDPDNPLLATYEYCQRG